MERHFYVYNQTGAAAQATVTYIPIGMTDPATEEMPVAPGQQRLLCTTEDPEVTVQCVSHDGTRHWGAHVIELDGAEHTHVIADAPVAPWPSPDTIQYPDEAT